jgi:hypothetical protein
MTLPGVAVGWRSRDEPLAVVGAAAAGDAARALATRVLARTDEALAKLRGVASARSSDTVAIVVLGDAADLPWLDGIVYLGRDPRAPSLLVPTFLEPDVPIELVERALLRRAHPGPLAVVPLAPLAPSPSLVVPCGAALALARRPLLSFAGRAP